MKLKTLVACSLISLFFLSETFAMRKEFTQTMPSRSRADIAQSKNDMFSKTWHGDESHSLNHSDKSKRTNKKSQNRNEFYDEDEETEDDFHNSHGSTFSVSSSDSDKSNSYLMTLKSDVENELTSTKKKSLFSRKGKNRKSNSENSLEQVTQSELTLLLKRDELQQVLSDAVNQLNKVENQLKKIQLSSSKQKTSKEVLQKVIEDRKQAWEEVWQARLDLLTINLKYSKLIRNENDGIDKLYTDASEYVKQLQSLETEAWENVRKSSKNLEKMEQQLESIIIKVQKADNKLTDEDLSSSSQAFNEANNLWTTAKNIVLDIKSATEQHEKNRIDARKASKSAKDAQELVRNSIESRTEQGNLQRLLNALSVQRLYELRKAEQQNSLLARSGISSQQTFNKNNTKGNSGNRKQNELLEQISQARSINELLAIEDLDLSDKLKESFNKFQKYQMYINPQSIPDDLYSDKKALHIKGNNFGKHLKTLLMSSTVKQSNIEDLRTDLSDIGRKLDLKIRDENSLLIAIGRTLYENPKKRSQGLYLQLLRAIILKLPDSKFKSMLPIAQALATEMLLADNVLSVNTTKTTR
ncbi:MAG: hypothetical protein IJ730_06375 [Alphaproteobacteria bacterium]|nr:hypothetical protein [Alphaproteobacteria bacterium]